MGPWNIHEFTRLRHKVYGWECTYVYDICYEDWFLWNGRSLIILSDWTLDEFKTIDYLS